jgi:transposase
MRRGLVRSRTFQPRCPVGAPRITDARTVVNAIFYLLRTGYQWRQLPREYPPVSFATYGRSASHCATIRCSNVR